METLQDLIGIAVFSALAVIMAIGIIKSYHKDKYTIEVTENED